jgi:uncharacterized Zn finger protein
MSKRGRRTYWSSYWSYPRTTPRPADGIKARTKRGQFGKSWWAGRWSAALEQLMDHKRLARGRTYARKGQVLDIKIAGGRVSAPVQGSRRKPYQVTIEIAPLSDKAWEKVADALAEQALYAAQLLAGEMPQDIEEAFAATGASLFPNKKKDLKTSCSCPDWANPCKHIAAVYYLLGEQFDEDPFLLFELRGRTREQVMASLRARRAGEAEADDSLRDGSQWTAEGEAMEDGLPLADSLTDYWSAGAALDQVRVTIEPPPVRAALLEQLGRPPFWDEAADLATLLSPAYDAVSTAALELAYGAEENGDEQLPRASHVS